MKDFKYIWAIGLIVTGIIIIAPILLLQINETESAADPWDHVPATARHTDHTNLLTGSFATGSEVTEACLECHENAGHEVAQTAHFTWLSDPVQVEGRDEPIQTGKANTINNFCIGIQPNLPGCTRCHAGYGWEDKTFDFTDETKVDCLVCHDQSGTYVKTTAGQVAEGVDLTLVAQSVGSPTRENCGGCHFNGGGGMGVKHGDLDDSLLFPPESVDVHMGQYDFQCITCHRTTHHEVAGRSISVSVDNANQVACTDCHARELHDDDRLNAHTDTVACQTCHIPAGATVEPTKMYWDWSAAGQDLPEDPHSYLKIKGSFVYESNFTPAYDWYKGEVNRYLLGDPIKVNGITILNEPYGDINDPEAMIWPFKIHGAKQIYDAVYNYLLVPQTVGNYWVNFDWDAALRAGSEWTGLAYSGEYGFAETEMYWPLTHMVVPAENALQCTDCHGENGRMDWEALGYFGDPMLWGGRDTQ